MGATLVKADKQLVRQAHELGANVKRVVDLALGDYIRRNLVVLKPEIKARKRPSRDCNGGMVEDNKPSHEYTHLVARWGRPVVTGPNGQGLNPPQNPAGLWSPRRWKGKSCRIRMSTGRPKFRPGLPFRSSYSYCKLDFNIGRRNRPSRADQDQVLAGDELVEVPDLFHLDVRIVRQAPALGRGHNEKTKPTSSNLFILCFDSPNGH